MFSRAQQPLLISAGDVLSVKYIKNDIYFVGNIDASSLQFKFFSCYFLGGFIITS